MPNDVLRSRRFTLPFAAHRVLRHCHVACWLGGQEGGSPARPPLPYQSGEAVRGEGPGRLGDAGEAWRHGLEEGDRGGEMVTVGVTAHHLAGALEAVAGIVTGIVSGAPSPGNFTRGQGVRRVGAAGNDDEGHPKEGEKSDDEAHGRDT